MKYTKTPLHHGYANQILAIDLETGKIDTHPLDPQIRDFFIGGRGLGLYLLHKKVNAKTTAYDPENPLIFSPGPLGGIPQFPGTSKCMAISLSPLDAHSGCFEFRRPFRRLPEIRRFRCSGDYGHCRKKYHDCYRRF